MSRFYGSLCRYCLIIHCFVSGVPGFAIVFEKEPKLNICFRFTGRFVIPIAQPKARKQGREHVALTLTVDNHPLALSFLDKAPDV